MRRVISKQVFPPTKRPRSAAPQRFVEFFRAFELELPAVVVVDMPDEYRDFGAGVEVFPRQHRAGFVVVKDYFISTIALFTQATLTVFAPHLERRFVVIEPTRHALRLRKPNP